MSSPNITQFREQLYGAWSLIDFSAVMVDDNLKPIPGASGMKPWADNVLGTILYTNNGYVSATLTNKAAAVPLSNPDVNLQWAQAIDEEVLRVSRALTTYAGPFEVKEENGELRLYHHVDIALHPNWIGKPQIRKPTIKKNENGDLVLILEPVQALSTKIGDKTVKFLGILTWKRLPDNVERQSKLS